jgi:hypothetical protein
MNMWPPSSRSKNKPNRISARSSACYLLHDGFLIGIFFVPEDGGDMYLRNAG